MCYLSFAVVTCTWDQDRVDVTEEVNKTVELCARCEGRYSSPFQIQVDCVSNRVPGFVSPGLVVHKGMNVLFPNYSNGQQFVGNYLGNEEVIYII